MISLPFAASRIRAAPWIGPAVQLVATLVILALPIPGILKLLAFGGIWLITFGPTTFRERVCFVVVCCFFSVMDLLAVQKSAFLFTHPNLLGLPYWEFFIWGFIVLHMLRAVGGLRPASSVLRILPLGVLFSLPFSIIVDPTVLLVVSALVLGLVIAFLHEPWDLRYMIYAVMLGVAFEYVGVWTDQWHYPGNPPGGVEPWFLPMWAGIGLFVRRLVLPLVVEPAPAQTKLPQDSGGR